MTTATYDPATNSIVLQLNPKTADGIARWLDQWQVGKIVVEPTLRPAWEHEYKYSALPISAGFIGIPGASETFSGTSEGHDSAIVSAVVSVQWTPQ
jgi:hypothetical protein